MYFELAILLVMSCPLAENFNLDDSRSRSLRVTRQSVLFENKL
jgi:hypothetical protein